MQIQLPRNSSLLTKNLRGRVPWHMISRRIVDNTNVLSERQLHWIQPGQCWRVQPGAVYTITKRNQDRWSNCSLDQFGQHHPENKWNSAVNITEKLTNIQALFHSEKLQKTKIEHASIYWRQHLMLLKENTTPTSEKQAQMFIMTESWPMDGCYRCSSLDVGHASAFKLSDAHVLYQDETGWARTFDLCWVKDQLLYKRNHCQLFEERPRTSRGMASMQTTELEPRR